MPKSPQEEGDKDRFSMRVGVEAVSRLKGMNRQVDAGAIPDDQFYHLENSRIVGSPGGGVRPRFGQLRSSSVDDGDVVGLFDASDIGAPTEVGGIGAAFECTSSGPGEPVGQRLYGFSSGIDGVVGMYDPVNGTRVSQGSYAGDGLPVSGAMLIKDPNAYRILLVSGDQGVWGLGANSLVPTRVFLRTTPPTGIACMSITYAEGEYLVGCSSATGTDIITWDGVTPSGAGSPALPLAIARAPMVLTYVGEPYVLFLASNPFDNTAVNTFYKRTAGVWAPITVPMASFGPACSAVFTDFDGYLYIGGYDGTAALGCILRYNGVAVTTVRTFAPGYAVHSLCNLGGFLYYVWRTALGAWWLGRYDGVTFTDAYRDLTPLNIAPYFLGSFQGETYLASLGNLLRTTNNNMAGAFTNVSNCFSYPSISFLYPGAVL